MLRDCALSLTLYGGVRGSPQYLEISCNIFGRGTPKHPLGFPTASKCFQVLKSVIAHRIIRKCRSPCSTIALLSLRALCKALLVLGIVLLVGRAAIIRFFCPW